MILGASVRSAASFTGNRTVVLSENGAREGGHLARRKGRRARS